MDKSDESLYPLTKYALYQLLGEFGECRSQLLETRPKYIDFCVVSYLG